MWVQLAYRGRGADAQGMAFDDRVTLRVEDFKRGGNGGTIDVCYRVTLGGYRAEFLSILTKWQVISVLVNLLIPKRKNFKYGIP